MISSYKGPFYNHAMMTKKSPDDVDQAIQDADQLDLRSEIQEDYGHHPILWPEWVFHALDFPDQARILELGSGSGRFWRQNLAQMPPGWKVCLSDVEWGMLVKARQTLMEQDGGAARHFHFLGADGQSLPFPDEDFDEVLALGVLDLVPDLSRTLGEVRRALRPQGQFVVSAGGKDHLSELEALLDPFVPAHQVGGDETRFGLENGKALLSPFFKDVMRLDYRDQLTFTEAEPILEYALSEPVVVDSMRLTTLAQLTQALKTELSHQGEIHITVHKGLFIARGKI